MVQRRKWGEDNDKQDITYSDDVWICRTWDNTYEKSST